MESTKIHQALGTSALQVGDSAREYSHFLENICPKYKGDLKSLNSTPYVADVKNAVKRLSWQSSV